MAPTYVYVTNSSVSTSPCHAARVFLVITTVLAVACAAMFVGSMFMPWTQIKFAFNSATISAEPFKLCVSGSSVGSKCDTWSSGGDEVTNLFWCPIGNSGSVASSTDSSGVTTTTTYNGPTPAALTRALQGTLVGACIGSVVFAVLVCLNAFDVIPPVPAITSVIVCLVSMVCGAAALILWAGLQVACPTTENFCHRQVNGNPLVAQCGAGDGPWLAIVPTGLLFILLFPACCANCCCKPKVARTVEYAAPAETPFAAGYSTDVYATPYAHHVQAAPETC